jgi:hypothetical protein
LARAPQPLAQPKQGIVRGPHYSARGRPARAEWHPAETAKSDGAFGHLVGDVVGLADRERDDRQGRALTRTLAPRSVCPAGLSVGERRYAAISGGGNPARACPGSGLLAEREFRKGQTIREYLGEKLIHHVALPPDSIRGHKTAEGHLDVFFWLGGSLDGARRGGLGRRRCRMVSERGPRFRFRFACPFVSPSEHVTVVPPGERRRSSP